MRDKPYKIGNGYYCDERASYKTFKEAIAHYKALPSTKGTTRVIDIWNADMCDVDSTGLTEEEQEIVDKIDYNRTL